MITLLSGLLFAIINVIMPHALHSTPARKQRRWQTGHHLYPPYVLLLVLTGIPMFIYVGPIIHLWIGQRYVRDGATAGVLIVAISSALSAARIP